MSDLELVGGFCWRFCLTEHHSKAGRNANAFCTTAPPFSMSMIRKHQPVSSLNIYRISHRKTIQQPINNISITIFVHFLNSSTVYLGITICTVYVPWALTARRRFSGYDLLQQRKEVTLRADAEERVHVRPEKWRADLIWSNFLLSTWKMFLNFPGVSLDFIGFIWTTWRYRH